MGSRSPPCASPRPCRCAQVPALRLSRNSSGSQPSSPALKRPARPSLLLAAGSADDAPGSSPGSPQFRPGSPQFRPSSPMRFGAAAARGAGSAEGEAAAAEEEDEDEEEFWGGAAAGGRAPAEAEAPRPKVTARAALCVLRVLRDVNDLACLEVRGWTVHAHSVLSQLAKGATQHMISRQRKQQATRTLSRAVSCAAAAAQVSARRGAPGGSPPIRTFLASLVDLRACLAGALAHLGALDHLASAYQ